MANPVILAIAIASAVSLLIVRPCGAQRKALRAYRETEALPIGVHGEDRGRPVRNMVGQVAISRSTDENRALQMRPASSRWHDKFLSQTLQP